MLNLKTLTTPVALLLVAIGASPMAGAAGTDVGPAETCVYGDRTVYRYAGHPSKSLPLPLVRKVEGSNCPLPARKSLVLASYLDAPGGNDLVAGNAELALRKINRDKRTSASEQINLCVANTVLRKWDDAQQACDAAVNAATLERTQTTARAGSFTRLADQRVAAAYSNRAVMHWMASDTGAAHADLSKARKLSPKAPFVVRNVELTVRVPAQLSFTLDADPVG
jgi:hypothetical protein